MNLKQINIIGAGQVGTALGYLLTQKVGLSLNCVLNNSVTSASKACDFIGQGKPITDFCDLTTADFYLISVPDQKIRPCATQLANTGVLRPGDIVLHCSGSLTSEELAAVRATGALIASLHPIKSFVDPQLSIATFSGTLFGLEGDPDACKILEGWVSQLDCEVLLISSQEKLIYHAAFVLGSNYLVALTEAALRCLHHINLTPEQAKSALQPVMRLTLEQVFKKGTSGALSGPISRGEGEVISKQYAALAAYDRKIAAVYQSLGKVAVELARLKDPDNESNFAHIETILNATM